MLPLFAVVIACDLRKPPRTVGGLQKISMLFREFSLPRGGGGAFTIVLRILLTGIYCRGRILLTSGCDCAGSHTSARIGPCPYSRKAAIAEACPARLLLSICTARPKFKAHYLRISTGLSSAMKCSFRPNNKLNGIG
jgi:hypothetical protein